MEDIGDPTDQTVNDPAGIGGFVTRVPADLDERHALAERLAEALFAEHDDDCGGDCTIYRDGHRVHSIHWRRTLESPEHFRSRRVTTVDGQQATVLLEDGTRILLWRHAPFAKVVQVGGKVRFHSRYRVLVSGATNISVRVVAPDATAT
jgi:hypothetical protein